MEMEVPSDADAHSIVVVPVRAVVVDVEAGRREAHVDAVAVGVKRFCPLSSVCTEKFEVILPFSVFYSGVALLTSPLKAGKKFHLFFCRTLLNPHEVRHSGDSQR